MLSYNFFFHSKMDQEQNEDQGISSLNSVNSEEGPSEDDLDAFGEALIRALEVVERDQSAAADDSGGEFP